MRVYGINAGARRAVLASLCFLGVVASAEAAPTSCEENYYSSEAPDIYNEELRHRAAEICHVGFAVVHSGVTATPLWSAQHLTAQRIYEAKQVDRIDRFYAEPALPATDRSELNHYARSGYDRGHLAPSADMASAKAQANSFSLSNIIPQEPDLNRNLWAEIEATVRGLALRYDDVYVVTGVAFQGQSLKALRGRVIVPSAVYKAIYIPSMNASAVWWAPNEKPGTKYEVISIDELTRRVNVDVFPKIDPSVKSVAARLPEPSRYADRAAKPRSVVKASVPDDASAVEASPLKELGKRVLIEAVKGVLR